MHPVRAQALLLDGTDFRGDWSCGREVPMQLQPSTQSCRVICVRGQGAQLLERQRQFARDEAVNLQAPIGKMFVDEIEVVLVLGVG
jgi:hypothetical protein